VNTAVRLKRAEIRIREGYLGVLQRAFAGEPDRDWILQKLRQVATTADLAELVAYSEHCRRLDDEALRREAGLPPPGEEPPAPVVVQPPPPSPMPSRPPRFPPAKAADGLVDAPPLWSSEGRLS
jgi:hypothetical protein